jgi:hypothetical protein
MISNNWPNGISTSKKTAAGVEVLEKHLKFAYPPMCWRFTSTKPGNAISPRPNAWSCMFQFITDVSDGKQLCISSEYPGCSGVATYLGFKKPGPNVGSFLAVKERFKKNVQLGNVFYQDIDAVPASAKYAVLSRVDNLTENDYPEVVVLWVNAVTLSSLVTLANYDTATNDNVIIPFASGCQGIYTIPYKEKVRNLPRAVVGLMDPSIRKLIPPDVLSFSVVTDRFIEMADNAAGSFINNQSA